MCTVTKLLFRVLKNVFLVLFFFILEKAMSKEADIAIFVKSNNNDSQVPQKKTKFSCSLKT